MSEKEDPGQQQHQDMRRAAAGLLRAAGRALAPETVPRPPPPPSAAFVSLAPGGAPSSPPPPKTGEHAPPEARVLPDPEDEWRKERRIGRGVGDEPPAGHGSRLGPYHLGQKDEEEGKEGEEEEKEGEEEGTKGEGGGGEAAAALPTPGRVPLRLRGRPLSLSPDPSSSPLADVPAHGADPSAKASSAPGTPHGKHGRAGPDLDFLGPGGEAEEEEAEEARAARGRAAAEGGETIWDRLRGPEASEANAASAEAEAEGLVGPGARAREAGVVAPRLGGGTGRAL